ncbi:DctP family TRAP transporter solute-binding subunit [Arenibaculum sp.]|jgi:tripartite ATP-independent transporter DctP family solute receptor|uniref:DctP family TRAP transporter solute-binding subunit n=1 Tax=Arenibaculum sp. TaxID=2865862 RepID=UPI002E12445F|nr:DctP family TRAP transporter solute-binding subunit [Arenibaculum sp.]
MLRVKSLLAGLAMAALALPAVAAEYKDEYRLSTVVGKPFPWGEGGERWAELIREKTDGRINVKMYPGVSLVNGDQTREFTALRQGVIDLAVGSTINWSPQVKELNLFSLPFLMPDYAAIDALTKGPVGESLFELLAEKDVVPLAWGENGFREVSNSSRAIRTPEDMRGLKMRVVGSPLFNDTFTALGANPTQMSWADAQPALSTGAVDGQENPLSIFTVAKLHTVGQDHVTLWGYVADPLIFVVNQEVWESWTPEDQQAVREAALQAAEEQVALARKGLADGDENLLKDIEANGVTVTRLSDEEKEAFRNATRAVYDAWAERIGPELVKQAEDSIAAR